eukprot:4057085-Pyramimonas_sp.AAC.1
MGGLDIGFSETLFDHQRHPHGRSNVAFDDSEEGAQLGTPDGDAAARSKRVNAGMSGSSMVSAPATGVTVEKVEMSPATVALLRHMMRDEIKLGISEFKRRAPKR